MREAIGTARLQDAALFFLLAISLTVSSFAAADEEKIFYGNDDRQDYYEQTDAGVIEWADSTCALVPISALSPLPGNRFGLNTTPYEIGGFAACEDEPFGDQPTAAFCTGFVVGQDLIATAGHCITNEIDLSATAFVFGFHMQAEDTPVTEFSQDQVYLGVELVGQALGGALDHAIIRLNRPITAPGAVVLPIRRTDDVNVGDPVGTIGYPTGLPSKFSFGEDTEVKENNPFFFTANLDAAGGNSGSPVFNTDENLVEGILVRGPAAQFVLRPEGCFNVTSFPDDNALLYVDTSKVNVFQELIPESGLSERGFDFRALPVSTAEGAPAVALTWFDPDLIGYDRATIVRSVSDYPTSNTEGAVIFNARDSKHLDLNVIAGTRYYYTLFITFNTGLVQVAFATVVAGSDAPVILSETFSGELTGGVEAPVDLQFTQITFTPVGPPVDRLNREVGYAGYESYEASIRNNIRNFEVVREDREGGSFALPLSDDGTFAYRLGDYRFPFFGREYSRFYIHANGFLSFSAVGFDDPLGFPGILQHFAIPRISGLFADLAPTNGGEVWARPLADRVAITFENVPTVGGGSIFNPPLGNSFQIELFYSGMIRFTYKTVGARGALIGISDGRGVPRIPQEVFPGVESTLDLVDFSELPAAPSQLHFEPVAPVVADEGALVQVTVRAVYDEEVGAPPILTAEWTREGSPPFADNGDGTGVFIWDTDNDDIGNTVLRVQARQGAARAYQDIRLIVGEVLTPPEARDLQLSTGSPAEDPEESRIVPSNRPMFASYDYFHPLEATNPSIYEEGPTILRWFRNGEMVPAFNDSLTVPAGATRPGEVWHFRVIPITVNIIAGDEAISPFVTIVDLPMIEAVSPSVGLTTGGQKVRIFGDSLTTPLGVTFGDTPASGIRVISDNELEVTTPVRNAGMVNVTVRTNKGVGTLPAAFRFVTSLDDLDKEDVNADGKVDAVDIQIVVGATLGKQAAASKAVKTPDTNGDGQVNAADVQLVVNRALLR